MKIGILLKDTAASQCNFSIINTTNIINQTTDHVVSLFYINKTVPCVRTLCCTTTLDKIYGFNGHLIATDVETARFLLRHNRESHDWYVWDLEWLRNRYMREDLIALYSSRKFNFVCRSKDHADELNKFTGQDYNRYVSDNFTAYLLERIRILTARANLLAEGDLKWPKVV